jgi:hypothetical protein
VVAFGRTSQRHFGVICVLGYVALSWMARYDMRLGQQISSLVYPLDTFSMYGSMPSARESHLLIRDAGGAIHRIEDFRAFDCAEPLSGDTVACRDRPAINYLYEEAIRYIESHKGPGDADAELVHRTWDLQAGARPVQIPDCVIAHCKVSR